MMQFIPLVVVPQVFFCGIVPINMMPTWMQVIGKIMPLEYSGIVSKAVVIGGESLMSNCVRPQVIILVIFFIILIMLNIIGLKRYRKV